MIKESDNKFMQIILERIQTGITNSKVIRQQGYKVDCVETETGTLTVDTHEVRITLVENFRDSSRPDIQCKVILKALSDSDTAYLGDQIEVITEVSCRRRRITYAGNKALQCITNARRFSGKVRADIIETLLQEIKKGTL